MGAQVQKWQHSDGSMARTLRRSLLVRDCTRVLPSEAGNVTAWPQRNQDRIVGSLVVSLQLGPESASFNPHNRVDIWVVLRATIKHLHRDCELFQVVQIACERVFHDMSQKAAQPGGRPERNA